MASDLKEKVVAITAVQERINERGGFKYLSFWFGFNKIGIQDVH